MIDFIIDMIGVFVITFLGHLVFPDINIYLMSSISLICMLQSQCKETKELRDEMLNNKL